MSIRQHFSQVLRVWFVLDQSISALTLAKLDDTHATPIEHNMNILSTIFSDIFFSGNDSAANKKKQHAISLRRKRNVWKRVDDITQCVLPNFFSHEKNSVRCYIYNSGRRVFAHGVSLQLTFVYQVFCIPPKRAFL